jgi:hypothetical protein
MKDSNTTTPNALDKFLDELDEKAQANGYPSGLIRKMRESPEMMDIMARMVGAELDVIKAERFRTRSRQTT